MELTHLYEMESLSELLEHAEAKAVIPELRDYISNWVRSGSYLISLDGSRTLNLRR